MVVKELEITKERAPRTDGLGIRMFTFIKKHKNVIIQYLGLVFVLLLFTVWTDGNLLSSFNVKTIIRQLAVLFTVSIGLVFVFSHGGMDISVGAVTALSSMSAALAMNAGAPLYVAALIAIVVSVSCYFINIMIAVQFGLMSVISSLAIMFIARGIVTYRVSTSVEAIKLQDSSALDMFRNQTFILISLIVIGVVGLVLFNWMKIGKQSRAIGDNPLASMQSGVLIKKTKMIGYLFAGVLVGYASLFSLARSSTISENTGSGLEMDVIVALVLGGLALNGGSKSKMSSAIVGTITYVLLNNGLVMVGVATEMVSLVKGLIFLVVVFLLLRRPNSEVVPR
ncbi:ABC transporter permease [Cohnella cholangitidis]|uniref:Autoinducer 2 import system permease protein LsrD n=1 Tax=Cohnella cholangitidis TaxID=2598458 RepID=A0A7G5C480_9BACL|nr:ABC transporter permease [Cohnella cholangitidis]QMV44014.1 ABC transporter permease [Cohnella cholangitidis]